MKKTKFMISGARLDVQLDSSASVKVEWEQTLSAVPSANCGSIRSTVVLRAD